MTKTCRKCGEAKPLSAFGKEPRVKDGLRARCRECESAQNAAWREANPEHVKAYSKVDAQRRKGYQREWRRNNPERVREYRQRNRTGAHDYLTQWRKQHGSAVRADTKAQNDPVQPL